MDRNAPFDDALQSAARGWVVTLVSGDVDEPTLTAFRAWRADSPDHAAAFESARRLYANEAIVHETQLRRDPARSRRAALFAAALAACMVLGLLTAWPDAFFAPDYATPDGPARRYALADGSHMLLDGGAAADIDMTGTRREVQLLRGRAWFEVAPDRARPFVVTAGGGSATAVGTAFAVDDARERTRVDVTHGIVRVEAGGKKLSLRIGQAASWSGAAGEDGAGLSARRTLPDALAWREGRIIIDDRRLDDALRLLDSYVPGRILVLGDIASARVGGVFASGNAERGLYALARSQGARVRRLGNLFIVSAW